VPYKTNPNPEPTPNLTTEPATDPASNLASNPASDPASYRDPNPYLTPDLTEIEEDALLADVDNLSMHDNFNIDDSFEADKLYLITEIENHTTSKHEQNTELPNTDEQHTNKPEIDQNIAEHTINRTNNDI
ncbi:Hypothetical predicted protein, partial [Paramuricea clavata]